MIDKEIKHEHIKATPSDGPVLARLEDIWNAVTKECDLMNHHFECVQIIRDEPKYKMVEIQPGVSVGLFDPTAPIPPFKGVAMCIHCVRRAAMHARDMATALDDLVAAAEDCK